MKASFVVHGEAKGKARPRFSLASKHVYTPDGTLYYESHVLNRFKTECQAWKVSDKAIKICVDVYTKIPKSTSQKRKILMLKQLIYPKKKPDADNILKAIFDSLNGVAYIDDCQIVRIEYAKLYDDVPRVEVTLEELEE